MRAKNVLCHKMLAIRFLVRHTRRALPHDFFSFFFLSILLHIFSQFIFNYFKSIQLLTVEHKNLIKHLRVGHTKKSIRNKKKKK